MAGQKGIIKLKGTIRAEQNERPEKDHLIVRVLCKRFL